MLLEHQLYLNEYKNLWQKDYAKSFSPEVAKKKQKQMLNLIIDMK
jgi:hypothetical protein